MGSAAGVMTRILVGLRGRRQRPGCLDIPMRRFRLDALETLVTGRGESLTRANRSKDRRREQMSRERKIKAAVCHEPGKPLQMEEVILEPPGKGEVMIRCAATSICHSDLHAMKGEHGPCRCLPWQDTRHAAMLRSGEGVTYVKPGDLVVYTLIPEPCDNCYYCNTGEFNQCINHQIVTRSPGRLRTKDGKRIYQWYGTMATFAEYATGWKRTWSRYLRRCQWTGLPC